ncbi:hypothetical protein HB763_15125 [Vibrio campbellii]|nr:hypothetical protein [Vibrio campbellii]UTZ37895.1 hypothetical protein HB763_15125 [Vibrio campbellii]
MTYEKGHKGKAESGITTQCQKVSPKKREERSEKREEYATLDGERKG